MYLYAQEKENLVNYDFADKLWDGDMTIPHITLAWLRAEKDMGHSAHYQ